MSEHPTYPNPTIREALCEIHFALPEDREWKASFFGDFFAALQPDFSGLEPAEEITWELKSGPNGGLGQTVQPRPRLRYKSATRPLLFQLSPGVLTVNVLPKYPGWGVFRDDIRNAWTKCAAIVGPRSVHRVGLRYIDFIERDSADEKPGAWLKPSDYLPSVVLSSERGFLSRAEIRPDRSRRYIVSLAETEGEPPPIVLDIDCIFEGDLQPDQESILRESDNLHAYQSDVFFACVSERLERRLSGE